MPQLHFIVRQPDISQLIGKGGAIVKSLENETNLKIDLRNDTGMLERDFSKLRCVLILGEKEDLIKGLVKIVANNLTPENNSPFLQLRLLPGGENKSLRPRAKGFWTKVSKLNEETAALVNVINLGPTGIHGIEILSTTADDMEDAVEKFMATFQSEGEDIGKNDHNRQQIIEVLKSGSIEQQVELITKKEIIAFLIPEEKSGLLVGPKGSTIKELEETNDVRIVVEKKDSPFFEAGRVVLVLGEIQGICECLAAVTDKIFDRDNIDPRVVCLLPEGVPKYLIGYSGETIKRIQQESGCSLKVEHVNIHPDKQIGDQEAMDQYCLIKGTREKVVKGIQAVVARILLQLVLQGQTSDATIPLQCNFGNFGAFDRRLSRQIIKKRRLLTESEVRPVQENYAPERAQAPTSRHYEPQDRRGPIYDDIQQPRYRENLVKYERRTSVDLPPEQGWSARLSYERIEPRVQEPWPATIVREPPILDSISYGRPVEMHPTRGSGGRDAIVARDVVDRGYGASRAPQRLVQTQWPTSSPYADIPARSTNPRYY